MEHHYLLTEDLPELEGREKEIVTRPTTGEIYLAPGTRRVCDRYLRPHGVVWSSLKTPEDFSMQLLPEDFERLAPYFEVGSGTSRHWDGSASGRRERSVHCSLRRQSAGRTGPGREETSWVACAVMAGFQPGGASAGAVALDGGERSGPGHHFMDVARFGAFATPKYTSLKVPENYSRRFRLAYPNEDCPQPVRCAAHRSTTGCRRPARSWRELRARECPVVRTGGRRADGDPTYRRSVAFPVVRPSVRRYARRSASTRHQLWEVRGRGARGARVARRVFASRIPNPGDSRSRPC